MTTQSNYALAINETARLRCHVEANPAPNNFYWTLNKHVPYQQSDHLVSGLSLNDSQNELNFTADASHKFGKLQIIS